LDVKSADDQTGCSPGNVGEVVAAEPGLEGHEGTTISIVLKVIVIEVLLHNKVGSVTQQATETKQRKKSSSVDKSTGPVKFVEHSAFKSVLVGSTVGQEMSALVLNKR